MSDPDLAVRYDGAGYPDGLKGENIPLQARILAVADTFDFRSRGGRSVSAGRSVTGACLQVRE